MRKRWKSLTSVQWFKGLGTWKPIQARCLRSQEGDEMIISAWIALENSFQIWVFKQKVQVCFLVYGAAFFGLYALGLHLVLMCEGSRVEKLIKNPWIDEEIFDFYGISFQIFFMQTWFKSCPIIKILSKSDHARNIECIPCIKRFENFGLLFSTYLF